MLWRVGLTLLTCFALAWAGQLLVLRHRLGTFDWDAYWATRRFYRPALITLGDWDLEAVPDEAFDPLSRRGATIGFTLAAGLYAAAAAPAAAAGVELARRGGIARRKRRRGR